jgi:hypothetical protein
MKRRDLLKLGVSAAAAPATPAPIVPQAAWTLQLFDAHQNEHGKAFVRCSEPEQIAMLEARGATFACRDSDRC